MPIDPRIATSLQPTDIAGAIQKGMDWHDQRQQQKSLKELLPQAAHGDQAAIDQLWAVDPRIAEHMDDRQRQQAAAMTEDLSAAVHWADTPEKWNYVQQHYGAQGVDLSPYRFEDRERGLMTLNKLTGYLKAQQGPDQPSSVREYEYAKGQGFGGSYMDFKNEFGSPIVQRNEDGTMTVYPRSVLGGGGQQSGPKPGQVEDGYRFKGGDPADPNNWHKISDGGPTPQASGGFPSSRY